LDRSSHADNHGTPVTISAKTLAALQAVGVNVALT
jgi:hypothetical protein